MTPFSSPQQTTNPAGLAAQNAAVTQAATNSAGNTPTALSQLSSFLSQAVEAPTGSRSTATSGHMTWITTVLTRQPDRSGIRGAIVVETASASNTAGTPP
ncbi:PPE family protein [Mycobacterium tuberculosis FJ05194]|nr:PPE family protein [Mycobacterium tuberculosis FJ05194]